MTDYPQGDGSPDCKICKGRGVIPATPEAKVFEYPCICTSSPEDVKEPKEPDPECDKCGGEGVRRERAAPLELSKPCSCVYVRDVIRNMERGCKGLIKGDPIEHSPLRGKERTNLWITATKKVLRDHLKHVAARMRPGWGFLVKTDADLMDAWLSPRLDVMDADVASARMKTQTGGFHALVDLVEPPELLIILAGVKTARNEAMPEVLLEAMRHREHRDIPTWVVDQPSVRLTDESHLSNSGAVVSTLQDWDWIGLDDSSGDRPKSKLQQAAQAASVPDAASAVGALFENFDEEVEDYTPSPPRSESQSTSGPTLMGQSDETRNLLEEEDADPAPDKNWKKGRRKK